LRSQRPVGSVDVQPQSRVDADIGDLIERIDCAGIDVAGGGHRAHGMKARGAVGVNLLPKCVGLHAQVRVDRDAHDRVLADAEHRGRFRHRHVRHLRRVDSRAARQGRHATLIEVDIGAGAKRGGKTGEIRE
jgi:hypothetical protein